MAEEKGAKKICVTVAIDRELYDIFKATADLEDRPMAKVLERLIKLYVSQQG